MRHLRYVAGFAVLLILSCTKEPAEPLEIIVEYTDDVASTGGQLIFAVRGLTH